MIVEIKGYSIEIDSENFELILNYSWSASVSKKGIKKKIYFLSIINGKTTYLHRMINKTPSGKICDHKDGNTLNCKRENLRVVTALQNRLNASKIPNSKSKYKGVYVKNNRKNKYYSLVQRQGLPALFFGYFYTEEEAADAYNNKMKELYGEYFAQSKV